MNMLNECMYECCYFSMCMMIKMHLCIINIPVCIFEFQFSFTILFYAIIKPVHVHGRLVWPDKASSRVLYAGRRHGDVTFSVSLQHLKQLIETIPLEARTERHKP